MRRKESLAATLKAGAPTGLRLLLATHVPFWAVSSGKDLRVAGLIRDLVRRGARVRVVSWDHLFPSERRAALALGIEGIISTGPWGGGLRRRLREGMPFQALRVLRSVRDALCRLRGYVPPPSRSLSSWRSERMLTALSATCREFRPDIVLVEYVALAYLHEAVPAGVLKAIDTHDVMHLRRQAYDRAGLPHWLDLDRDEEAAALRPFDIVLAIQEEEAGIFRAMLPGTRVLTCPPWFEANDTAGQTGAETAPPGAFRLLLVASRMEANVRGLDDFLRESWPAVRRARPDCVLRVCGTVCEPFAGQRHPGVAFLGFVPDLTAEYRTADVVISPVTFGGGIKVKCLEALAHGCACVFSRHSVVGLEPPGRETWLVAGDPAEFAACLVALAGDPERRTALRREAVGYIRTCYGAERSMGPFLAALKEMLAARAPDAENGGSTRT